MSSVETGLARMKMPDPFDPIREILPTRFYVSGSRADASLLDVDAIIAVGDSQQPWIADWTQKSYERIGDARKDGNVRLTVFLHAPLIDSRGFLDVATAKTVAAFGANLLRDNRRLLVHCDAGAFRSPFMATLILADIMNIDGPDALRIVKTHCKRGPLDRIGIEDFDLLITQTRAKS